MNPTPTQAEAPQEMPTPRTESLEFYAEWTSESKGGQVVLSKDYAILERELATTQAELTTLREKLAEEQAGAASMREALGQLHAKAGEAATESGAIWAAWVCTISEKALLSTTGKATLEELERLRAEVHQVKGENARLDGLVFMPGDYRCPKCDFINHRRTLSAATGEVRASIIEEDIKCPNDGEQMQRITWREGSESNYEFAEKLLKDRDSALATITELRARVKTLEGAMKRAMSVPGFRNVHGSKFISDALQPAPAEPEKAIISDKS